MIHPSTAGWDGYVGMAVGVSLAPDAPAVPRGPAWWRRLFGWLGAMILRTMGRPR